MKIDTREIMLKNGLWPKWSGVGPDSGRDLLVREELKGFIKNDDRLWLVDCKNNAISEKRVGVSNVMDIRDRCERTGATGYLLVCTTTITSELARKLDEINENTGITTDTWDSVTLEKLLLTPVSYSLAQQFFPVSLQSPAWRIFFTEREERWMAHYTGYFLYVESRTGIDPPPLGELESIINKLDNVEIGSKESLRVRAIWHDNANLSSYCIIVDYLVPSDALPTRAPSEILEKLMGSNIHESEVTWYIRLQIVLLNSDSYSRDDLSYYDEFKKPLYHALYKIGTTGDLAKQHNRWIDKKPPLIRTFVDVVMWQRDREIHGFADGSVTYKY